MEVLRTFYRSGEEVEEEDERTSNVINIKAGNRFLVPLLLSFCSPIYFRYFVTCSYRCLLEIRTSLRAWP